MPSTRPRIWRPLLSRRCRGLQELPSEAADGPARAAGRIALSLFTLADFQTPPRERGLELREFVRGVPQVEIRVRPATETGLRPVTRRGAAEYPFDRPSSGRLPPSTHFWHGRPRRIFRRSAATAAKSLLRTTWPRLGLCRHRAGQTLRKAV